MILVTGANGFLGKVVMRKLEEKEKDVRGVDRSVVDLTMQGELEDVVKEKIETIVHIAGATESNRGCLTTNETMAINVVEAAKKMGVKRIIFISSNSVNYSQREYAVSKKIAEDIIKNSGLEWVIIRPTIIFGNGSKEVRMIGVYVGGWPVVPLFGGAEGQCSPIWVDDVADFIVGCLDKWKRCEGKIISIGGLVKMNNHQMAEMVIKANNWVKPIIDLPSSLITWMNPEFYKSLWADISVDNSEAEKLFGWKPHKLIPEMLGALE
jgi:nucleoside-diphosphate-sugar epimerase